MRSYDDSLPGMFDEAESRGLLVSTSEPALREALRRRALSGELTQPYPGAFARAGAWSKLDPKAAHAMVARTLASMRPSLCLCHVSAAVLYGLQVSWRQLDMPWVVTSAQTHTKSTFHMHRLIVEDDSPQAIGGVLVTSPLRTVFDCTRLLEFGNAVAVADSALRAGLVAREQLMDYIERHPRVRGVPQARRVAAFADGRAENGGESLTRAMIYRLGFVVPDLQHEVQDDIGRRIFRVDFCWERRDGSLVFGELDGHEKYVNPDMTGGRGIEAVLTDERRREARITRQGAVVRFSLQEVMDAAFFARLLDDYGVPHAKHRPKLRWKAADVALP